MEPVATLSRSAAITAAAAAVLRGRGYASVGIDEIAAAAGLTGPALYRYFQGKHEVLVDVVSGFVDRLAQLGAGAGPAALARLVVEHPDAASVTVRRFSLIDRAVGAELLESVPAHARALLPVDETASTERRIRLRALYGAAIHCGLAHGASGAERVRTAGRVAELLWQAPLAIGPYEPRPQRRLLPVSRREAIMAVASDLFSQRGYGGVTLRDIGAELDVTASAVTRHFGTKEEVLEALFDRASHQVGAALQTAMRRAGDPYDALMRVLRGYSDMAVENRELLIIFSSERNSLSESNRERRRANQAGYVAEVRRLLRLAVPGLSRESAQLRSALVLSAVNEVLFDERACGHRDLAAALATLGRHVLGGPAAPDPGGPAAPDPGGPAAPDPGAEPAPNRPRSTTESSGTPPRKGKNA